MSYGVGHRRSSDLVLLWLWCRPAAVAPIGPVAWEPPYAVSAASEKKKKLNLSLQQKFCFSLTAFMYIIVRNCFLKMLVVKLLYFKWTVMSKTDLKVVP